MEELQSDNRYLKNGETNPYSETGFMRSMSWNDLYWYHFNKGE